MRPVNAEAVPKYFGRTVRSVELDGLRLTEKKHAAGDRIGPHGHSLPYATVVLEGGYEERRGKSSDACAAGSVVFHEAGERHANRFGPRDTKLVNLTWVGPGLVHRFAAARICSGRAARRLSLEIASEMAHPDSSTRILLESLAAEVAVLGSVNRSGSSVMPGWLCQIEERVRDEYLKPLTLRDLAPWRRGSPVTPRPHVSVTLRALCGIIHS